MSRSLALGFALFSALAAAPGCGAMMGLASPGLGVTTGGAQDVGLARNLVAAGQIPEPSAFVIEGLLAEHDLPIPHAPCERLLCFDAAVGVAPALDTGRDSAFMVVGFSSSVVPSALQRPALNLALVIDKSGSMAGAKITAARDAVHRVIDQLGPGDRLTLMAFDDGVEVLAEGVAVSEGQRARLHRLVSRIDDDGGTNLERALGEAFARLEDQRSDGRSDRVLLVTDARPTVGPTGESAFVELAGAWAAQGYGLTVVGVGLDFGQDLTLAISRLPGGNFVYLEHEGKLAERLGEGFDHLVTPLAWDLEMRVEPLEGYRVARAFGVPSWVADAGDGAVVIHLPTLFPSKHRGAIVLALEPAEAGRPIAHGPLARDVLSYREARGGEVVRWEGTVAVPEVAEDAVGVVRAVALVQAGLGLQRAATLAREGRYAAALDVLAAVRGVVGEEELDGEERLVADLERVIAAHAEAEARAAQGEGEPGEGGEGEGRWIR